MKDSSTFKVHCVDISGLFSFLLSFLVIRTLMTRTKGNTLGNWGVMHGGSCVCTSSFSGVLWSTCIWLWPYDLFSASSIRPRQPEESEAKKWHQECYKATRCHPPRDSLSSTRLAEKNDSCFGRHRVGYPSHQKREERRREAWEESIEGGKKSKIERANLCWPVSSSLPRMPKLRPKLSTVTAVCTVS